ncbi:PilZ domain-containing protein [Paraneptunicella aestuarii]|uniref:PilZ domain-containing protein n=1 Tax=Paraneptunicella aestuarii TaxID=2831148 RepID=UPI001E3DEDFA|nr:PilZ domain-containing protein [Paraneptunicella aestuarii]UAA40018.1 PilZ domain-containing protein [Paraneptunicella aestuarii]
MNQDLEQYRDIIEQLKPFVKEPDFNKILDQVAAKVPKPKRFLLKMELKRLARPCTRIIDLRGRVDGECHPHDHEGTTHFMDDVAREVFESQVRIFGEYTLGVYEAVNNTENNFRVMQQKERQSDDPHQNNPLYTSANKQVAKPEPEEEPVSYIVPTHCFASNAQRSEERMNFAINVELFSELNKSVQATSIDLSVNGLRIKTDSKSIFKMNETYHVFFRGLESEYALDRRNGIPYKVVKIERNDDEQRIGLKRSEDPKHANFETFLTQFIKGNKRRYKVNIDNTLQAIQSKSYEQYYIPNFTSIPVYIEHIDEIYRPRFILSNDCNKSSIYYWSDEQNQLCFSNLLNSRRITKAITSGMNEFFVYAFNNVSNEKVFFYSASNFELASNDEIRKAYQGFASRKASWRIYKVQLTTASSNQSFRPLSLPDDIGDNVRKENQPPAPRLLAKLKHISHIALVTDITDPVSTIAYQKYQVAKNHLPIIKKFGHAKTGKPDPLSVFRFKYQNLRAENRYQLRTPIELSHLGKIYKGITDDVSPGGMRLELETPFDGHTYAIIEMALPKLQAMTKKYELSGLLYEVRNISKDGKVVNLKTFKEEDSTSIPVAYRFFSELIKNNRKKLKSDLDEEEFPGIGEALKNIYANNVLNIGFFLKKRGIHLVPDAMTKPAHYNRLLPMFTHGCPERDTQTALPLYSADKKDSQYIPETLKTMSTSTNPVARELFIAYKPDAATPEEAFKGVFYDHFSDEKEQQDFIAKAIKQGRFFAIRIFVARTGRPDTDLLRLEMSYVNMYAQHKAKSLEKDLWEVTGVGDIIDVTDESMRRCGFLEKHIIRNKGEDSHALREIH